MIMVFLMKILLTTSQLFNLVKENNILEQSQDKVNLTKQYNFHIIPDGKNNFRSAQLPINVLEKVIDVYKIKTIIRFNGDGNDAKHTSGQKEVSIDSEKQLSEKKGVKFLKLSSTKNQDQVNSLLSQGNVLIHCAHGADRTGGNVGGYLYDVLNWSTQKIWDYTTKYNGWVNMINGNPDGFVKGGYLKQAQKFGVKDLEHAKKLIKK